MPEPRRALPALRNGREASFSPMNSLYFTRPSSAKVLLSWQANSWKLRTDEKRKDIVWNGSVAAARYTEPAGTPQIPTTMFSHQILIVKTHCCFPRGGQQSNFPINSVAVMRTAATRKKERASPLNRICYGVSKNFVSRRVLPQGAPHCFFHNRMRVVSNSANSFVGIFARVRIQWRWVLSRRCCNQP